MLLLNVKSNKKETYIEVQNGDKAYRSRSLSLTETEFYCKEVVISMISSANFLVPVLYRSIPDPVELKKPLTDGFGLSDDHKKLIQVKGGKETVIDQGARWMIADSLKIQVAHALTLGNHMKGIWNERPHIPKA